MENRRDRAFELFDQGHRPSSPDCKALGLKSKSLYNYFQLWKKQNGNGTVPDESGNAPPHHPPQQAGKGPLTTDFDGSAYVTIFPKAFTMSSTTIWMAMQAAIRQWGWPADMTPEEFLEYYLYISFKQRGITLAGYTVTEETEDGDEAVRRASTGGAYPNAN